MRWGPDTCGCVFQVDNNFQYVGTEKTCSEHLTLSGQALFTQVHVNENQLKNNTELAMKRALPHLIEPVIDGESVSIEWKKGVKFAYTFDAMRNLKVNLAGIDQGKKDAIKKAMDDFVATIPAGVDASALQIAVNDAKVSVDDSFGGLSAQELLTVDTVIAATPEIADKVTTDGAVTLDQ